MHVLIADARSAIPALQQAADGVDRPAWRALQKRLSLGNRIELDALAWSTPYEVAVARALGLPDTAGQIAWAAYETQTFNLPCAFITPCHWQVHSDHLSLSDPAQLGLDDAQSQALLRIFQPFFAQDGIQLQPYRAGVWLASGEVFRDLASASLDRAIGRNIDAWMPPTNEPRGAALRRLQNEMQMLLYTHVFNDERASRGLQPVNSFWVSGAGMLPGPLATRADVQCATHLRHAAIQMDASAYATAWAQLDTQTLAPALEVIKRGKPLQVTLCDELVAQTWGPVQKNLVQKLKGLFGT